MVAGFRCGTDEFAYVILEGTRTEPLIIDSGIRKGPREFSHAEFLKWARERIQEIIDGHNISCLGYKRTETLVRAKEERSHLEGVLIECARSIGIQDIISKLNAQIRRDMAFPEKARYITRLLTPGPLAQFHRRGIISEAAIVALCLLEE